MENKAIEEIFEKIETPILNSNNYQRTICLLEKYQKIADQISSMDRLYRNSIYNTLFNIELTYNQEMEGISEFCTLIDRELHKKSALEESIKLATSSKKYSLENLRQLHKMVIRGTEDDEEKNYSYREYDVRVSGIYYGKEELSYIPPKPENIIDIMKSLIEYANSSIDNTTDVFIKPITIHALISILQPFGNGNTRFARIVQHGEFFALSRDYLGMEIKSPILYLSKNYLLNRGGYRSNIEKVATQQGDEAWNNWIEYNLNMIDEQLYYLNNSVEKCASK